MAPAEITKSSPNDFRPLVRERISSLFGIPPTPVQIPKQGGYFTAKLCRDGRGVEVDNLRQQPFLKWEAFYEAVHAIIKNDGETIRGNAMKPRLGDAELPLHSIEGWVAHAVYKKRIGQSVFRRIVPLVRILEAAGIAENDEGVVRLTGEFNRELDSLQRKAPHSNQEEVDEIEREDNLEATF